MAIAMEGEDMEDEESGEIRLDEKEGEEEVKEPEEQLQLSIKALDGGMTDTTMKLRGTINKNQYYLLLIVGVHIVLLIVSWLETLNWPFPLLDLFL